MSELKELSYFIDVDGFEEGERSFAVLAERCLCKDCRERLISDLQPATPVSLILNVRDHCCNVPGFLGSRLPLLEKVFRLLLSKGNEPLSLAELGEELSLCSGDVSTPLSPEVLKRLLDSDAHYGFCQRPREP